MFDLATRDIKFISGVGPQKAAVLNKELEIYSLHDLIYYFPYKYIDRSRIYYIHEIDGNMPYIQLKGEILGFAPPMLAATLLNTPRKPELVPMMIGTLPPTGPMANNWIKVTTPAMIIAFCNRAT